MTWSRAFPEAFPLANGRVIATLREAGELILGLPELHRNNGHWQGAGKATDPQRQGTCPKPACGGLQAAMASRAYGEGEFVARAFDAADPNSRFGRRND